MHVLDGIGVTTQEEVGVDLLAETCGAQGLAIGENGQAVFLVLKGVALAELGLLDGLDSKEVTSAVDVFTIIQAELLVEAEFVTETVHVEGLALDEALFVQSKVLTELVGLLHNRLLFCLFVCGELEVKKKVRGN